MSNIKFGTDGWRAIIAKDFTVANVARVARASALWIKKNQPQRPRVVIGYDCRFGSRRMTWPRPFQQERQSHSTF